MHSLGTLGFELCQAEASLALEQGPEEILADGIESDEMRIVLQRKFECQGNASLALPAVVDMDEDGFVCNSKTCLVRLSAAPWLAAAPSTRRVNATSARAQSST
jgi:hypothetical protein